MVKAYSEFFGGVFFKILKNFSKQYCFNTLFLFFLIAKTFSKQYCFERICSKCTEFSFRDTIQSFPTVMIYHFSGFYQFRKRFIISLGYHFSGLKISEMFGTNLWWPNVLLCCKMHWNAMQMHFIRSKRKNTNSGGILQSKTCMFCLIFVVHGVINAFSAFFQVWI